MVSEKSSQKINKILISNFPGITFSFGMFYVEFLTYFGESKGKTALIGSIFMATPLLSGPVASFLTDMYGCRKVTIFGSILAAIGFVLSAMSNSIEMLFLNFGIIAGFGLSLCYVAAVVIVAYYFDKRRSLATGISVCGSGVGTFLFSPIIQYLIEHYGWRGATLILAGIFLNMCICGCLMRYDSSFLLLETRIIKFSLNFPGTLNGPRLKQRRNESRKAKRNQSIRIQ